jgi:hypothetical protein
LPSGTCILQWKLLGSRPSTIHSPHLVLPICCSSSPVTRHSHNPHNPVIRALSSVFELLVHYHRETHFSIAFFAYLKSTGPQDRPTTQPQTSASRAGCIPREQVLSCAWHFRGTVRAWAPELERWRGRKKRKRKRRVQPAEF